MRAAWVPESHLEQICLGELPNQDLSHWALGEQYINFYCGKCLKYWGLFVITVEHQIP